MKANFFDNTYCFLKFYEKNAVEMPSHNNSSSKKCSLNNKNAKIHTVQKQINLDINENNAFFHKISQNVTADCLSDYSFFYTNLQICSVISMDNF